MPNQLMPNEIKEMWIFVTADSDGEDCVIILESPQGWLPFIACNRERFEVLIPAAQKYAARNNQPVRVLHAAGFEQVDLIMPPGTQH